MVTSTSDDGEFVRVMVEVTRRRRLFEAKVPADATRAEVELFLEQLRRTLERKFPERTT